MFMSKITAYEFGKIAYENNISAPAFHKDFLDAHIAGLQVGESIYKFKEWSAGWKDANKKHLSLPIFEVIWNDGKCEYLEGHTIIWALINAGYDRSVFGDIVSFETI
jgi:hypothetical protein